jgi:hypothetical protein
MVDAGMLDERDPALSDEAHDGSKSGPSQPTRCDQSADGATPRLGNEPLDSGVVVRVRAAAGVMQECGVVNDVTRKVGVGDGQDAVGKPPRKLAGHELARLPETLAHGPRHRLHRNCELAPVRQRREKVKGVAVLDAGGVTVCDGSGLLPQVGDLWMRQEEERGFPL